MRKYLEIFKITWDEYMTYRLNFVMWRVRVVLRMLVVYFLWNTIFLERTELFGYDKSQILTYVLLTPIITSLITGTRSVDIGGEITGGDLTNYLLKPLSYFRYWWTKDLADKLLNILFSLVELSIFIMLVKPLIFIPTDFSMLVWFLLSLSVSLFLYFFLNLLLGFLAFWTPEVWGPRFLLLIIQEFLSGGLFPLDILPKNIYNLVMFLPFPYLSYFPLSIYLGRQNIIGIIMGILVSMIWAIVLYYLMLMVWKKGLKKYAAEGR